MRTNELINSGLEAIQTVIEALSKDAIGSEFMPQYAQNRDIQKETAERQATSLKELVETSAKMEENTRVMAERSAANADSLNEIYNTINSLKDSTARIEQDYKHYVEQFQDLILQTKTITGFISEIQKISSQTNLLSFNASIEAAHAGTAGAGFRIIANEVKKLSDNTEKSAAKIMHNVSQLESSITELEEETKHNTESLGRLTSEVEKTLQNYEAVRVSNSESQSCMESFNSTISENVKRIDTIMETVNENETISTSTNEMLTDCASKNQIMFNEISAAMNQIKTIFEKLKTEDPFEEEVTASDVAPAEGISDLDIDLDLPEIL